MDRASQSPQSYPIPIKKRDLNKITEYCLNVNVFNPNKKSPPNSWNKRLMKRLACSYESQTNLSILITK